MIETVRQLIADADHITFLTGAGISAESGIPTFRGDSGVWNNVSIEKFSTVNGFNANPRDVWEWNIDRRNEMMAANPNDAHFAIADLEKRKPTTIITQNIDLLHERAGSTNVIKVHGDIRNVKCDNCGTSTVFDLTEEQLDNLPPVCDICAGIIRPDIVLFGEELPIVACNEISQALSIPNNILLVVGTSNNVSTSVGIINLARKHDMKIVIVNPNNDHDPSVVDYFIKGAAGDIIPKLVESL